MGYIWRFCLISRWSLAAFDKQHVNEKSSYFPNTFNKFHLKKADIKNKKYIKGDITKCECSQIWEQLQWSGTLHCNWLTAVVSFSQKSRLHHVKIRQKLTNYASAYYFKTLSDLRACKYEKKLFEWWLVYLKYRAALFFTCFYITRQRGDSFFSLLCLRIFKVFKVTNLLRILTLKKPEMYGE